MPAGSTTNDEPPAPRRRRRSMFWVALSAAAVAVVAMTVSLLALRRADHAAADAEAELAMRTEAAEQLEQEVAANDERIATTRDEVTAMRALLQPGTPEALQAVYLEIVAAACADPGHDVEGAVAGIVASAAPSTFPAQPGWEAAIDQDAVSTAMVDCEAGDG